jgi:hypothetical protein
MGKLNDVTIRGWIRSGERFEGRSDGDGLALTWRKDTSSPLWKFRYHFAGRPRVMNLGSYSDLLEAARTVMPVAKLADEFFERMVLGKWKHPNIVRSRIENDIKPNIGKLALGDVEPRHIDAMLQTVVKRGAPTMANDVLR